MSIALREEHVALQESAARWLADRSPRDGVRAGRRDGEGLHVEGVLRPVLSAGAASYVLAPVVVDGDRLWCLVDPLSVTALDTLDLTRRVGEVAVSGPAVPVAVSDDDVDT